MVKVQWERDSIAPHLAIDATRIQPLDIYRAIQFPSICIPLAFVLPCLAPSFSGLTRETRLRGQPVDDNSVFKKNLRVLAAQRCCTTTNR